MPSELIFPHLTDTGPPPNPHAVVAKYEEVFAARVAEGVLRPLVLPYFLYGIALLVVYLCIPHTKSTTLYAARWPVLLAIISFHLKALFETSSGNVGIAALTGVSSGFVIILASTWLVWCKPQFNAKRVQRRKKLDVSKRVKGAHENPALREPVTILIRDRAQKTVQDTLTIGGIEKKIGLVARGEGLKQRRDGNREPKKGLAAENLAPSDTGSGETDGRHAPTGEQDEFEYFWEAYPDTLRDRIPWVIDLLSNTRGIGWNWAIPTIPDLPDHIKEQLGEPVNQHPPKRVSNRILPSHRAIIRYRLPQLVICYLLFDVIKTLQMKDPYFIFGPSTYEPTSFLRNLPPFLLFSFRYFLCCTFGFAVPLQFLFVIQDLVTCFLGPDILGVAAEPWHMPTTWGTPMAVFNSGLNGFWGNLWHQRLRIFFSAPTDYLVEHGYLAPGSLAAKWTGLLIAFAISGFVHACISIAQFQQTHPWRMFVFFLLHALGIVIQTSFCAIFRPWIKKIPKLIRQIGNFVFTFTWCATTGPLYADDIAKGGSWLNEPVPISLFRGLLDLGVEGDGWWCWNMYIRGSWYRGKHWWDSGFAL